MSSEHLTFISVWVRQLFKQLAFILLLVLGTACQPADERAGLWLRGTDVMSAVDSWQFTDEIQEIAVETKTWYLIPHSTTIWCVQYEGNLYVGSYGTTKKYWERRIESDPRARVKINDEIYKVLISPVEDAALTSELDTAYNSKYDMEEVFGDSIPPWWFYRIEQAL